MPLHLITGHKGEAHITSADVGIFNAGMFGQGDYVLDIGRKFEIDVISNNAVRIYDGDLIMQGRHINLKADTYEDLTIESGTADMNRIDLIVVRYTQDITTSFESAEFAVIKGTPSSGDAVVPEHTAGDILSGGCVLHEMPLYKIPISGLTVGVPEKLFIVSGAVAKSGSTMTGTLTLKRMFGENAETGGLFPSAYTIGSDRTFAITRTVNEAVESMLFFNRNGLGLYNPVGNDYSYFARVVKGTYTGNGNEKQFIDLGFTPSAVLVTSGSGLINRYNTVSGRAQIFGGLALSGYSANLVYIVNNGFEVYGASDESRANASGDIYKYIVLR